MAVTAYLKLASGQTMPVEMKNGRGYINGIPVSQFSNIQWVPTPNVKQPGGAYGYYQEVPLRSAVNNISSATPNKQSNTVNSTTNLAQQNNYASSYTPGYTDKSSLISSLSGILGSSNNNSYLNTIQNLIGEYTTQQYTPKSESEIMSLAEKKADLYISPLIQALNNRIDTAKTTAESQKKNIEAAYANVGTISKELMDEVAKKALETAIARGGGRSGAVEYLTAQLQKPIVQQVAQAEAEKAAKLSNVDAELATYIQNAQNELQNLNAQKSKLVEDYYNTLKQQELALAQGQTQLAAELAERLASINTQYQSLQNQTLQTLLPYFTTTAAQDQESAIQQLALVGQVPGATTTTTSTPYLTDLLKSYNASVSYNPKGGTYKVGGKTYYGTVVINGKEYTPIQLIQLGAVYDAESKKWKIPQSVISKLLQ